jgi:ABC-type Fe3+/spermidine/putrescine transport system ATPase subunit
VSIVTTASSLAARGDVLVAIRSDRMKISRVARRLRAVGAPGDETAEEPTLLSRIAAIEYQGSNVKLRLETDGVEELTVTMPDRAFYTDAVAVGDTVAVGWDDADAHVVR